MEVEGALSPRERAPAAGQPARPAQGGLLAAAAHGLPTALVLSALAATGWLGHHWNWKLPPLARWLGQADVRPGEWCTEHGVPEAICVECRLETYPKPTYFGWCKEHGVHECTLCHPEVAQLKGARMITEADRQRAARALAVRPRPENHSRYKLYQRRLQLVSAEGLEKAGIDVGVAWQSPVVEAMTANGRIEYDQTRSARLSARAGGVMWRVDKTVGEDVRKGAVLALLDAPEVGRVKAELSTNLIRYQLAATNLENLRAAAQAVAGRKLLETEAELREAQVKLEIAQQTLCNLGLDADWEELKDSTPRQLAERLRLFGIDPSVVKTLDERAPGNLIPITAPLDGVIVRRDVVAGEVVNTDRLLFEVADVRSLWITLAVPIEERPFVSLGQELRFRPDGAADEVSGKVVWISTQADEHTRTVEVRATVANPEGRLVANAFGTGRIILREEKRAIVVPKESLHWDGNAHLVFVQDKDFLKPEAPKVFHPRVVRPGASDGTQVEIIAGVLPGEVVATKGSGIFKAELLKSNLGAG